MSGKKFSGPVNGRQSTPWIVWKLWTSIKELQAKKWPTSSSDIEDLMREKRVESKETLKEIRWAQKDGLLILSNGTQYDVPRDADIEAKGYRDWYCFVCHLSGPLYPCPRCWRVFHEACRDTHQKKGCGHCFSKSDPREPDIRRQAVTLEVVNQSLGYALKEATINAGVVLMLFDKKTASAADCFYKSAFKCRKTFKALTSKLVAFNVTIEDIMVRIKENKYRRFDDFLSDCKLMGHNVCIVYGSGSGYFKEASKFCDTVTDEISQIRNCLDCYQKSHQNVPKWFTVPCDPVHETVLAKMKGHSHWPAKVIKRTGVNVLVTFFGEEHEYGSIESMNIFPLKATFIRYKSKKLKEALVEYDAYRAVMAETGVNLPSLEDDEEEEMKKTKSLAKKVTTKEKKLKEKQRQKMIKVKVEDSDLSESEDEESHSHLIKCTSSRSRNVSLKREEAIPAVSDMEGSEPDARRHSKQNVNSNNRGESKSRARSKVVQGDEGQGISPVIIREADSSSAVHIPGRGGHAGQATGGGFSETDTSGSKQDQEMLHLTRRRAELKRMEDKLREEYKKKEKALGDQLRNFERLVEETQVRNEVQLQEIKKRQWCVICLNQALYYCCKQSFYCSSECQNRHWKEGHRRVCLSKRK